MKLTSQAFEAVYQACSPIQRRSFFKYLRQSKPAFNAAVDIEVPAPPASVILDGKSYISLRLIAVADGMWDVER